MSLVPYTITALERDVADADASGKQVIVGATCSMFIQPANTAVQLYDNAAGSNGSTAKTTGANGQVTVYIEPAEYRVAVNGVDSFKIVGRDDTEFGTAAIADVTTSTTDSTAGRLTKVGDFGSGSLSGISLGATSLDNALTSGTYYYSTNTTETPEAGTFGTVHVEKLGVNAGSQFAISTSNGKSFFRAFTNSGFTDWQEIYHSGNTNFNVFESLSGSEDFIATGSARSADTAIFFLPIPFTQVPSSITATGTFQIIEPSTQNVLVTNIPAADIILGEKTSSKIVVVAWVGLTGLTTGQDLLLNSANSGAITVNK
jgi:hypothetical protein